MESRRGPAGVVPSRAVGALRWVFVALRGARRGGEEGAAGGGAFGGGPRGPGARAVSSPSLFWCHFSVSGNGLAQRRPRPGGRWSGPAPAPGAHPAWSHPVPTVRRARREYKPASQGGWVAAAPAWLLLLSSRFRSRSGTRRPRRGSSSAPFGRVGGRHPCIASCVRFPRPAPPALRFRCPLAGLLFVDIYLLYIHTYIYIKTSVN
jgi:hypothetical protein